MWKSGMSAMLKLGLCGMLAGCATGKPPAPSGQPEGGPEKPASAAQTPTPEQEKNPVVIIQTTMGDIKIALESEKAPVTVKNFLQYVDDGYYKDTIFHRVISNFMIQGGGFTRDMERQPGGRAPIALESKNGLKNTRGSVAMARTSAPESATSQFFINVVDNPSLDYPSFDGHGYAVFGRVVEGLDVVDRIKSTPTGSAGPHQNVPNEPIAITGVVRAE